MEILDGEPLTDYLKCVGCTDCARACPTNALVAERRGYGIRIGGKLGRHPQLAHSIVHLASDDEVISALMSCIKLYMRNARGGERFNAVVNRLDPESFVQAVVEQMRNIKA
jgi:dissimilatory sulfite reductase (desulfoviridin) alpha/beta subunit